MPRAEQAKRSGVLIGCILDFVSWMRQTGFAVPAGAGSLRWAEEEVVVMTDETSPSASTPAGSERRKRVPGGRKGGRYNVKVTPVEGGVLERIAAAQHVSVPRLLVEAAMSSERRETPTERKAAMAELFKAFRLMAGIANNVNQLAKVANATREVPAELPATLAAARRVMERIDAALDEIDGVSA